MSWNKLQLESACQIRRSLVTVLSGSVGVVSDIVGVMSDIVVMSVSDSVGVMFVSQVGLTVSIGVIYYVVSDSVGVVLLCV